MTFKHKANEIQETHDKKFLNQNEKNIVENIQRYTSSNHTFSKSIKIRNTSKLLIPRINIGGECYQNLLDVNSNTLYRTYPTATGEIEETFSTKDFLTFKVKKPVSLLFLWINAGMLVDVLKPSTVYTLVLDYYSNKEIKEIDTRFLGHDVKNPNSDITKTVIRKKSGRAFINIQTNPTINKTNSQMACIYNYIYVDNIEVGDFFYFGNARLFEGVITEGDYKSNGNIKRITGVGDISRNLFNPNTVRHRSLDVNTGVIGGEHESYILSEFIPVNGGQRYVLYDELQDAASSRYIAEYNEDKTFIKSTKMELHNCGSQKHITLDPNTAYVLIRFWCSDKDKGLSEIRHDFSPHKNIMFRRDYYEPTVFEPFYEGYKISLQSNNRNIFDPNNLVTGNIRSHSVNGYLISDTVQGDVAPDKSYGLVCNKNLIKLKPNTRYNVRRGVDYANLNICVEKIDFYDEKGLSVCGTVDVYGGSVYNSSQFNFTTHNNVMYMRMSFKSFKQNEEISLNPSDVKKCGFTISEYENVTENYESDTLDIYLDEPLLKLPNGTKDEIKDGYLIRRIGKVVFDGDEDFTSNNYEYNDLSLKFEYFLNDSNSSQNELICNNINTFHDGCNNTRTENFYISGHPERDRIVIVIPKSKLTTSDLEGFKYWLSKNPVTVYYERVTPIVTKLNTKGLSTFDGHTEIRSNNNLGSTTQFTLPGNLNSRIDISKNRLFTLKQRINSLEQISLTSILNVVDIKESEKDNE